MKLTQAILTEKRINRDIDTLKSRINEWNVVKFINVHVPADNPNTVTNAPRPFNVIEEINRLAGKLDELIKLKTEINHAYNDISELLIKKDTTEGYVSFLKGINEKEEFYGQCDKAIDEVKRDSLIESALEELDEINLAILKFEEEKVL